jgi:hypothetical protein
MLSELLGMCLDSEPSVTSKVDVVHSRFIALDKRWTRCHLPKQELNRWMWLARDCDDRQGLDSVEHGNRGRLPLFGRPDSEVLALPPLADDICHVFAGEVA